MTRFDEKVRGLARKGRSFLDILGDSLIEESRKGKAEIVKVADTVSEKLGLGKDSEPVR